MKTRVVVSRGWISCADHSRRPVHGCSSKEEELVVPWVTMPGQERDIILDRYIVDGIKCEGIGWKGQL